jgi:hypothetical protein
MSRKPLIQDAVADILRERGPLYPDEIAREMMARDVWLDADAGLAKQRTQTALYRMRVAGRVRRDEFQRYTLLRIDETAGAGGDLEIPPTVSSKPLPAPAPAPAARVVDDVIGIPHLQGVHPSLIRAALRALLICGQTLADALDDAPEGSAIEEYLAGALREQSQQAAMMRLMMEEASGAHPQ